ncbi:FAD-dependent monooxygenase [Streptomyces sp. NPDC091292]|uniref:FAD-dependent monooxygenase n=1 Tax=Streptomyces sp. NPDC091292 TaxID=3365991 RepID=UPI00382AE8E5
MVGQGPDHDVVIVGGGPVGMMLAIELGRRDVDVLVVERRESRLRHPRAVGVHPRTMEIFRQLGMADEVRQAGGLPLDEWHTVGFMTRLTTPEIGRIDLVGGPDGVAAALEISPELTAWCAQDILEPLLRERAAKLPSVRVAYGLRATGVRQNADGVTVTTAHERTGEETQFSARYLVGADGGRSTVRKSVGIDAPRSRTLSHQMNVCFEADLRPYMGDRKHILWWIVNPETQGTFLTYDGDMTWVYSWNYDPERENPGDYSPERCVEVIRSAIGTDDDVDISLVGLFPWTIDSALADRFQEGRVLLVGDAAHRLPPTGGFGMNSGIQDAQNLAWKLDAVLRGQAGPGLLATYAEERRAVAAGNIEQALTTAAASMRASWLSYDAERLGNIEKPEGAADRQRIADNLDGQEPQYSTYGQQFGVVYESAAVVPDGTAPEPSTVTEYRPSARPGAHAPHRWLRTRSGERVSTVDLLHSRFVVLATPEGRAWLDAVPDVAAELGLGIGAFTIGTGGDLTDEDGGPAWWSRYGIGPTGVLLVRPDGHVAFRAADAEGGGRPPAAVLTAALRRVLHLGDL